MYIIKNSTYYTHKGQVNPWNAGSSTASLELSGFAAWKDSQKVIASVIIIMIVQRCHQRIVNIVGIYADNKQNHNENNEGEDEIFHFRFRKMNFKI